MSAGVRQEWNRVTSVPGSQIEEEIKEKGRKNT